MSKAHVLVLTGDGINCELECAKAFNLAGLKTTILHINDLLQDTHLLAKYDVMCLPGGFSFGDDLGSGLVLANKIKFGLQQEFYRFVDEQKPILGICNGFQVLAKLGVLPNYQKPRSFTLTLNASKQYINRWVELSVPNNSQCVWTKGIKQIALPIRHGEGRLVFAGDQPAAYQTLYDKGQIALHYLDNPNGSFNGTAGICDEKGLIFGLMPHPEAAMYGYQNATNTPSQASFGQGFNLFKNISDYLNNS